MEEANRVLSRLEQISSCRLFEAVDSQPAPAPGACGRSARQGAAAQVFGAVCRHDPPLPPREGVDALSDLAEDVFQYARDDRGDMVPTTEAWGDWFSLPGGTVGEFNAVERLGAVRRSLYEDISKVLVPPSVGLQEAENTNAYVGL